MLKCLKKRWFLISLVVFITSGLALGKTIPASEAEAFFDRVSPTLTPALAMFPRAVTTVVLFLMAFSLDSRQLISSFRSPAPVLWASLVNYGFIPLLAWLLIRTLPPASPDFAIGLMIAASMPCTMAAASVWTRKAGGNDAVSLMVTFTTNAVCFAVTPFWLNVSTGNSVRFDVSDMVLRLFIVVLVPTLLGQMLRRSPKPAEFATNHKTLIGGLAQACILSVVFYAACKAGIRLAGSGPSPGMGAVGLVWGQCIGVHVVAMIVGMKGAAAFGFTSADRSAIAFSSSQKTLPIGVLLATDPTMFGDPNLLGPGQGLPFAVFPMLMYHASQLVLDTVVADRLAAKR